MPKFLDEYRVKRSPDRTPEPFGGGAARPGLFVVQKHEATRLHYDLRLEWGGALRSWAVPKGPSPDPADKRMAMQTEDHPVEYADFEGIIPKGNYGAGAMIVWDRGRWAPLGDPEAGYRDGKILFELRGYKLRGLWTLVRPKKSKEWLLIKETADDHVRRGGVFDERSILSGLTVEELRDGRGRADAVRRELAALSLPDVARGELAPMLAEPRAEPFDDPSWLFEVKYDGFRALAGKDAGRAFVTYRRGADATAVFPDLAPALRALPADVVLDGELVVLDDAGRPVFQRLQKRALLTAPRDIERATVDLPVSLFCFDVLSVEGRDVRALPLVRRKELLARLLPDAGPLRLVDAIEGRGKDLYASVRELGLEGIVAKRKQSAYRAGRFRDWIKVRVDRVADFAVVGFTHGEGSRTGFGALHVAGVQDGALVYVGRVGGGFDEKELERARAQLEPLRVKAPPCRGPLPRGAGHAWVAPKLVVEVRYKEITEEGLLRQPTFLRFRDDKAPDECELPGGALVSPPPPAAEPKPQARASNETKIFWPDDGFTKGDLIAYYRDIAPWLLPYLRDRPVVLTRFPDGIGGKSFFQKDAPEHTPGWVHTARLYGDEGREIDHFICDDLPTLLYVANLGSIPLHVWASRLQAQQQPDWCILDLDPKTAPFADVVTLALAAHELCDEIGLPAYLKTSGQKGLHVLIPLGGQCTHAQSTALAELLARVIESRHPDISTTARAIPARRGRVYLDFLQNGHGKTIASQFSARPVRGATVSMPVRWSEVGPKLDPARYTIKTAPRLAAKWKEDPMASVLMEKPDLRAALARLAERLPAWNKKS